MLSIIICELIIIINWQIRMGGYSWGFMVGGGGGCCLALKILTLNIVSDQYLWDKCKGKLPPGIFAVFTYDDKHYKLLTIKHIKRRQRLNQDVFEASALCFFIVSFKRCYDEYLLWVFLFFLLKFEPFDEFFPFQNVIANLSVCSYCVCVYSH